jgi:hypothetical protein
MRSTCSLAKLKDADDIQTFSLACIFALKMNMPTERETRIFRILYLFRRNSRKSYGSYACSLFWTLFWSVSL